jgi:ABC-type nitrate/sulfonate/bicarbonate transport system ATPase subunit
VCETPEDKPFCGWHNDCDERKSMSVKVQISRLETVFHANGDQVHALGPIDLEIERGEFLCVIGESGCGKSTLLRILAGLQSPTSGRITIDGRPITGPSHRRGVVFQTPSLLPWLSVRKNVELGFRIRNEPVVRSQIDATLELVGLEGFDRARPRNLSGGMAQRAAIARALVSTPEILLLDEPFSALDAFTRMRMQKEVQRIWLEKGLTVVFITHDIDEAILLATRVVVMTGRPGRIGRIFQIPLPMPRSVRSGEFLRLKSVIADELHTILEGEAMDRSRTEIPLRS